MSPELAYSRLFLCRRDTVLEICITAGGLIAPGRQRQCKQLWPQRSDKLDVLQQWSFMVLSALVFLFFLVGHILSCCLSLQFLSFLFLVLFSLLAFVFFTRSFAGKRNTKTNTTDKSSFLCFFHFRSCFVFFICIHIVFSLEIVMLIRKLLRYKPFNLHLKK